ncbi:hypothetical protein [Ralstonia insidiosa]|jgi:hypothetical protein|nr:hypothetical protein [Ralstonia insidiosa]MBA9939881.1 hypothetical protein [Ralstonia insidiosa]MBC9968543.1 hypothetical protein [Ralstonia insidiosa]MBX3904636.1 hypothetical protein [Ralstonia insidiosa]
MLNNGQIVTARRAYPLIANVGTLGVVVDAPASMPGQQGAMVLITPRGYIVIEQGEVEPTKRSLVGASFDVCNAARVQGTLLQTLIEPLPDSYREMGDAELVRRLMEAQQHNPVTGNTADLDAEVAIREELNHRRAGAAKSATSGAVAAGNNASEVRS